MISKEEITGFLNFLWSSEIDEAQKFIQDKLRNLPESELYEFVSEFLAELSKNWHLLDRYRINKFYSFIVYTFSFGSLHQHIYSFEKDQRINRFIVNHLKTVVLKNNKIF